MIGHRPCLAGVDLQRRGGFGELDVLPELTTSFVDSAGRTVANFKIRRVIQFECSLIDAQRITHGDIRRVAEQAAVHDDPPRAIGREVVNDLHGRASQLDGIGSAIAGERDLIRAERISVGKIDLNDVVVTRPLDDDLLTRRNDLLHFAIDGDRVARG